MTPAKGGPTAQTSHAFASPSRMELLAEVGGGTVFPKTTKAGTAGVGQCPLVILFLILFDVFGINAESSSLSGGGRPTRPRKCTSAIDGRARIDAASFVETQHLPQFEGYFFVHHADGCLVGVVGVGCVAVRLVLRCPVYLGDGAIAIIVIARLCYVHYFCIIPGCV